MEGFIVYNDDLLNVYQNSQFYIEHWTDILEELKLGIQAIDDMTDFQGEAAESIKDYMNTVHIEQIIPALETMLQSYHDMLVLYVNNFHENVDDYEHFYICESVVKQANEDYRNLWTRVDDCNSMLSDKIAQISDWLEEGISAPDLSPAQSKTSRLSYRLSHTVDTVWRIDGKDSKANLSVIGDSISAADTMLDEILENSNRAKDPYIVSSVDGLGTNVFQHMNHSVYVVKKFEEQNKGMIASAEARTESQVQLVEGQKLQEERAFQDLLLSTSAYFWGGVCVVAAATIAAPAVAVIAVVVGTNTLAYGLSKELDFEQHSAKVREGNIDASTFNFIRDTVFLGNQEAYDKWGGLNTQASKTISLACIFTNIGGAKSASEVIKSLGGTAVNGIKGRVLSNANDHIIDYCDQKYGMSDDERIAATIALNLIEMKAEGAFYNRNGNSKALGFSSGSGKTSYAQSSLNELKNTENFTDSSIEHIFKGQINKRGKAVGYHYEGIEETPGKVLSGTQLPANEFGVYKAQVEVNGIPKIANGGYSTFYSKNMSPQEVVDAINEAYGNCALKPGTRNTYQGVTSSGLQIEMFLDQNKKIISAFPKE